MKDNSLESKNEVSTSSYDSAKEVGDRKGLPIGFLQFGEGRAAEGRRIPRDHTACIFYIADWDSDLPYVLRCNTSNISVRQSPSVLNCSLSPLRCLRMCLVCHDL